MSQGSSIHAYVVRAQGGGRAPVELELHELAEQHVERARVRLDHEVRPRMLSDQQELGSSPMNAIPSE